VVALAPAVLLAVLGPHLNAVDAALAPGMGLLTWTSLNIDGYLHRVHLVCDRQSPCRDEGMNRKTSQRMAASSVPTTILGAFARVYGSVNQPSFNVNYTIR